MIRGLEFVASPYDNPSASYYLDSLGSRQSNYPSDN